MRKTHDHYVLQIANALTEAEQDGYDPAEVLRAATSEETWARAAPERWGCVRAWPLHGTATSQQPENS